MARSKYGNMPPKPAYTATVRGDAGTYEVWGIDWMNHRVLLNRASSLEWTPISKISLVPAPAGDDPQSVQEHDQ